MQALNKKRWKTFRTRCLGGDISQIHVEEKRKKGDIHLMYNAKEPQSGRIWQDRWIVSAKNRPENEVKSEIETFNKMVREDFWVVGDPTPEES